MQTRKNEIHLIALASTNDLIAVEDQYHYSCYTDYTRLVNGKKVVEKSEYQKLVLEAFLEVIIKGCHDITCSPKILKFLELFLIMKNHFLKNSLPISQSTKKNLRRNIEKCLGDELKVINVRGTLFLHTFVMSVEQVIILFFEPGKDDYAAKSAAAIRKEGKCLKDHSPWPPQPSDLKQEKI